MPPVPLDQLLPPLAQVAQAAAVMVLAVLFWPMVRVIRARHLDYWAWGWVALGGSLLALFLSFRLTAVAVPLRSLYLLGGYAFAFLLWAGCRAYATARRVRRRDTLWLVGPVGFAAVGPLALPGIAPLFAAHSLLLAAFFLAALWQTRRFRRTGAGGWVFRVAVGVLAVLFAHYAALVVVTALFSPSGTRFGYMAFSSVYDAAAEVALGFGMVSLATARQRAEMEGASRRLAAALSEVGKAARTDALTGLLNRRGLDDLLADPDRVHAGCVAAIDVNNLKPLNDQHGHAAGDVALQLVARALRNLFRVTDPIVRSGGDEFLALMPGGDAAELTRRMEALDAALVGQRVPGVEEPFDVRVAWGVAEYPAAAAVPAALQAADEAMYEQKRTRKEPSNA